MWFISESKNYVVEFVQVIWLDVVFLIRLPVSVGNLRSEWHVSTNLAMQFVNCAPWSPTLQCRHGCMSPSCGKGRMHSGGEHEWQIQRPHLRQWCFLKQSTEAHLVDPSKKRQTIYLTEMVSKWWLATNLKSTIEPWMVPGRYMTPLVHLKARTPGIIFRSSK